MQFLLLENILVKKVVEVFKTDKGYYSWIMNGDFPEYTKKIFTQLKLSLLNSE